MKSVMLRLRSGASYQVLLDERLWNVNGWTVCYILDDDGRYAREVMIRTSDIVWIEKIDRIYATPKAHLVPGWRVDLEVVEGVLIASPSDGVGVGWAEEFRHQNKLWSIRGVGADVMKIVNSSL